MTRKRGSFSPEFKANAASLVLDQGYLLTEAVNAVGVGESSLRRWIRQLEEERHGVTPASKAFTPEQQRIQELEARCRDLEQEKLILKKSTALLMSDDWKRSR